MMCQLWEDYCMLRIYTLQGVDHHRLLVRGQRVANACNYKAAVESETSKDIMTRLIALKNDHRVIVIATHNPIIWEMADEVISIHDL